METKEELYRYYKQKGYTFDFERVYERYKNDHGSWPKLFEAIQRNQQQERPTFTMKPKKGNDMVAIYRELFGDKAEEIYQARLRYIEAFKKSGCKTFKEFEENEKGNN